jgi:methionyl-tRNA formyltransferase
MVDPPLRPPRAIFFGSPDFAVPFLDVVAAGAELCAVVSQPDRPAGRGKQLAAPAVKSAALRLAVPVLQPERIRTPDFEAALRALRPEIFVVVAYGRILPPALLEIPRLGPWNVHASLLPKLRGAAPIQWSIIRGETRTGVAVMRMEAGLDTGPVAAMAETAIADDDTAGTLSARLARLGADLLADVLPRIAAGGVTLTPQDDALATLAPPLVKDDGRLDFAQTARAVSARARGVDPWPGATAILDGEPIKLFRPVVLDTAAEAAAAALPAGARGPGHVWGAAPQSGLVVACGDGAVAFAELQLPGRKRLPTDVVLNGRPIPPGTRLR